MKKKFLIISIASLLSLLSCKLLLEEEEGFTINNDDGFTIIYDSNEKDLSDPIILDIKYKNGDKAKLLTKWILGQDYLNSNSLFLGWNTSPDGSGISYEPGDEIIINSDIVLYAQWGYTIVYDLNGAKSDNIPADSTIYKTGDICTVLDTDSSSFKINSVFQHRWNTEADGTGKDYFTGDLLTIDSRSITLYAVYIDINNLTIGDYGPAGGYIFYDEGSWVNGYRYFEAGLVDIIVDEWGTYGLNESGAVGTEIGTGKQNSLSNNAAMYPCNDYGVYVGDIYYKDWFLPSKDELNLMYKNLFVYGIGNFGSLNESFYWSSSQDTEYKAWIQQFYQGAQTSSDKRSSGVVRPIRCF